MSSSTATSTSSGKRTGIGGGGGGTGGGAGGGGVITMPQVNVHSAKLPLFNRNDWPRARFRDVKVCK